MLYKFLNYFFFLFHTMLILFNCFGWIFPKLRKWNLVTLLLTAFSWFVVGIWYGWGYCFCTDWHWEVRSQLGYQDASSSYIYFLLEELTGLHLPEKAVGAIVVIVFLLSLIASLWLNIRDYKAKR
jgi:hypothetical protein